jgi:nucleotide-binding universal stress UspA family protein
MKTFPESDRILWTIDPFAKHAMLQRSAAWAIHEIARNRPSAVIQPVYLVNNWIQDAVPPHLVKSFIEKMAAFARDSLEGIVRRVPLQGMRPLEVLSYSFESLEQGVDGLLTYARKKRFGLIVASTRANKKGVGGPLSFLGSFVETLAEQTDVPLMIVNPAWRHSVRTPSLLFPTDLSAESRRSFKRTIEFIAPGDVTLFYKVDFPLSQPVQVASRIFPEIREILFRKTASAQIEAKRWSKITEKKGVRVSFQLDSRTDKTLSEAILEWLDKNSGMVVLAPPVSATFPSTVIRTLIQRSRFPVLYFPTELRPQSRSFAAREAA